MKFYSQIGQDKWVASKSEYKKNGYFIDIGAGHPIDINNTYYLENELNWTGLSVDIGPPTAYGFRDGSHTIDSYKKYWSEKRSSKIHCEDALLIDYIKLFNEYDVPKFIDYLSMDIHPPFATCKVLEKIPFDKYKFKFITFETDSHRDERTREFSRNILESLGYKIITSDIQEDWYINDNFN